MRKAMICVSVLLALFHLWPIVFSPRVPPTAAQGARPAALATQVMPTQIGVVAMVDQPPPMAPAAATVAVPKSCYRQYRMTVDRCPAGDRSCQARTADQWDLCEARGMWPQ